jgi:phosphatidylinositol alpha-1,6-mannosyltransferase
MGIKTFVGITHGHEAGWSITPITRQLLRRIGTSVDVLTYLGNYTREKIGRILPQENFDAMRQLAPAVDAAVFAPGNRIAGQKLRNQAGLEGKRVIVCVSRLMERKGQDSLIEAMPEILLQVPNAHLLIVGGGSYEDTLQSLVASHGLAEHVTLTGKVSFEELPHWYAAGDVFAMPCRTRNAGWDVEGLGIVFLEASATGLPVIAGNSGGAPDAVLGGVTGFVVDGKDSTDLVRRTIQLLNDPQLCEQFGLAGRAWVESNWTWERSVRRLQVLLEGRDPDDEELA